jgi:hypothetical protein
VEQLLRAGEPIRADDACEVTVRRLVETRTRSFDQGILALRVVLAGRHGQLETACDTLIASLAERYEDDVTIVLARSV